MPAAPPPGPGTTNPDPAGGGVIQPILAGVVTAVVGFTSSFAIVLAGLRAVGASPAQASSGLLVLSVSMGLGAVIFSWRYRMPITLAWSAAGVALLAGAATPAVGFGGAVLAFAVAGVLVTICGFVRPLGDLVARIPAALANAMLAGILLSLCVQPFRAAVEAPAAILPVIAVWLVLTRVAPRWAVPGALAAALVAIAVSGGYADLAAVPLAPVVHGVAPAWDPASVIALALPLFLVAMTSQNIPGIAVLGSFGYRAPVAPVLIYTGLASTGGAFLGSSGINFSAVAAALAAGPQAHPDPSRRWIAGVTTGVVYMAFGPLAALITGVASVAPAGLMETVAGLALILTFASAARAALNDVDHRDAGAVTFIIAASGLQFAGIGSAFWALVGGALYLFVTRIGRRPADGAANAGPVDPGRATEPAAESGAERPAAG